MNEAIAKSIKLINLRCRVSTEGTINVIRLYIQFQTLDLSNKSPKQTKEASFSINLKNIMSRLPYQKYTQTI